MLVESIKDLVGTLGLHRDKGEEMDANELRKKERFLPHTWRLVGLQVCVACASGVHFRVSLLQLLSDMTNTPWLFNGFVDSTITTTGWLLLQQQLTNALHNIITLNDVFFNTSSQARARVDNCIGMNELNVTEIIAADNQPELWWRKLLLRRLLWNSRAEDSQPALRRQRLCGIKAMQKKFITIEQKKASSATAACSNGSRIHRYLGNPGNGCVNHQATSLTHCFQKPRRSRGKNKQTQRRRKKGGYERWSGRKARKTINLVTRGCQTMGRGGGGDGTKPNNKTKTAKWEWAECSTS